MVPRRHVLQGALQRSLLTHLRMHMYLVTSPCACLPRPSSHPYINPDSTCSSYWSFHCILCVFLLVYLLYYYSGYEPPFVNHTTRSSCKSKSYPRSSSSLTCATLHRGHKPTITVHTKKSNEPRKIDLWGFLTFLFNINLFNYFLNSCSTVLMHLIINWWVQNSLISVSIAKLTKCY